VASLSIAYNNVNFYIMTPSRDDKPLVYFIGIGGIGMSALARWFLSQGYNVMGSDISDSGTVKELQKEGVRVKIGPHNPKNITKEVKRVIYNQAIEKNNPELQKTLELNIPAQTYPESLGELTKIYKTIAIAGAHGKSTTTSLVALILQKAKLDPTVIVGTKLKEFGNKNFRNGKSDYLVIEADEYKASFLNYSPYAALITNIDHEHLDFYKNISNIKKTFVQFLNKVHPYGLVVLNKDNTHLKSISRKVKNPIVWYSMKGSEAKFIKSILKIPGRHNLSNAVGAYNIGRALGIKKSDILETLGEYNGAWRRSEYKGDYNKIKIFDDYAHHPTEIKATLQGFKEKFPNHRLVCIFQPHQVERLKMLFNKFVSALSLADDLMLLDIYKVAGREEDAGAMTSEYLAKNISNKSKKPVPVIKTIGQLKIALNKNSDKNKIAIMMGAGNINEWTDHLINI